MYGYIYKTTNLINNKIYIGQKKSSKFLGEKYLGSGIRLKEALYKYGQENFKTELIDTAESQDDLDIKEKYWINYYNSKDKFIGYNIADGGQWSTNYHLGMLGKTQSDKQKKAVSNYMTNRIVTEETRNKMSQSAKKRIKNRKTINGKHWVYNGKQKLPVDSEAIDYYISLGYKIGSPHSKQILNKIHEKYKNGTYIHKGDKIKFVSNSDLFYYKSLGYIEGKGNRPKSTNLNISNGKRNTFAITDGKILKYIHLENWEEYKQKGFYKCSLQKFNNIVEKYKETPDELREHLKALQN